VNSEDATLNQELKLFHQAEKPNQISITDGLLYISIWLAYSSQLFSKTLIWMLLRHYFIDVIKVHNQLT
jgi:uncharacterized protein (DUF1697 family)